jgi:Tol biopolymer transport system component
MRYWVIALCALVFGWGQVAAQEPERNEQVLLREGKSVALWDIDTQTLEYLPDLNNYYFHPTRSPNGRYLDRIWSPDGRYLLIQPQVASPAIQIYDLQERRFLSQSFGYEATWSPDGKIIAYLTLDSRDPVVRSLHLYCWLEGYEKIIYRATNHEVAYSLKLGSLEWSPNSQSLFFSEVYHSGFTSVEHAMLLNLGSGSAREVDVRLSADYRPLWSPNGNYFILQLEQTPGYENPPQNDTEVGDLYVVDVETGQLIRITFTPFAYESDIAWSSDGKTISYNTTETRSLRLDEALNLPQDFTDPPIPYLSRVEMEGGNLVSISPTGQYEFWNGMMYRVYITDDEGDIIATLGGPETITDYRDNYDFLGWRPPSP